jgi:hypothetical protein
MVVRVVLVPVVVLVLLVVFMSRVIEHQQEQVPEHKEQMVHLGIAEAAVEAVLVLPILVDMVVMQMVLAAEQMVKMAAEAAVVLLNRVVVVHQEL